METGGVSGEIGRRGQAQGRESFGREGSYQH